MFQIKICGITRESDALAAAQAGADAIGLNFYASSPRCVKPEVARAIASALPAHVQKVGVFVNATAEEILATIERVGLTAVQLHGDESAEFAASITRVPVLRAFRLRDANTRPVLDYVARCRDLNRPVAGLLIDAYSGGSYGGTGQTADWSVAARLRDGLSEPLILAGGLKAENVAVAIAAVQPTGVDTASGVETSPGVKDPALISAFVAAAKAAF